MRPIREIVIHCSDSGFGSAAMIDEWHRAQGWKGIGYHYVVLNGRRNGAGHHYVREDDGLVEVGRPEGERGAHVHGFNRHTLGICLIGNRELQFTPLQVFSLITLVERLQAKYGIDTDEVKGHYEYPTAGGKTCPDFSVSSLRSFLHRADPPGG